MTIASLILSAAPAAYRASISGEILWDIVLLGLLVAVAIAIIVQRSLFAVVMFSGVYSLVSAAFFVVLDAVDVAFTEAAVGAGVSTILMLGAMLLTARQARKVPARRRWGPLIAVLATGAALIYASKDMPRFGDPEAPANAYIGRSYLVRTPHEVGAPNVVAAVLASYRGYDTLGETVVIFTAGLGVMLLLGLRDPGEGRRGGNQRSATGRAAAGQGGPRPSSASTSPPKAATADSSVGGRSLPSKGAGGAAARADEGGSA